MNMILSKTFRQVSVSGPPCRRSRHPKLSWNTITYTYTCWNTWRLVVAAPKQSNYVMIVDSSYDQTEDKYDFPETPITNLKYVSLSLL